MIFYFKANGEPIAHVPERITQGSNKANTVYFIAPIAESVSVSVSFTLPNGEQTVPHVMTPVYLPDESVFDDGEICSIRSYDIPSAVTKIQGVAQASFSMTGAGGEVLNTISTSFVIEKGIVPSEPEEGDSYAEVLSLLTSLSTRVSQTESDDENMAERLSDAEDDLATAKSSIESLTTAKTVIDGRITANESAVSTHDGKIEELADRIGVCEGIVEGATVIKTTVTDSYVARSTAGGLKIADGAITEITEISGDTVAGETAVYDAYFNKIQSYGRNLFYGDPDSTRMGLSVSYDSDTGIFTVNGVCNQKNGTLLYHKMGNLGNSKFALKFEKIGGSAHNENGENCATPLNVYYMVGSYLYASQVNESLPFECKNIGKTGITYCSIVTDINNFVTFNDYKFRVTLVKGDYTADTLTSFEPYIIPDGVYSADAVRLGKWDKIDVSNQKLIRQTGYQTKETEFTEDELSSFSEYVLSTDGKSVAYKKAVADYTDFAIEKRYNAYNGGMEIIEQGDTDNSQIGAEISVKQYYYVLRG